MESPLDELPDLSKPAQPVFLEKRWLGFLTKIARMGQWLFWISIVYTALWWYASILLSDFVRMNPVARSTAWGRFKWHFPSYFEFAGMVVPLFFLFVFQSELKKGCARADAGLIEKGLRYLYWFFLAQLVVVSLKLIFEFFIRSNW